MTKMAFKLFFWRGPFKSIYYYLSGMYYIVTQLPFHGNSWNFRDDNSKFEPSFHKVSAVLLR